MGKQITPIRVALYQSGNVRGLGEISISLISVYILLDDTPLEVDATGMVELQAPY